MAYPLAPHRDKKIRQGRATDRQGRWEGGGAYPLHLLYAAALTKRIITNRDLRRRERVIIVEQHRVTGQGGRRETHRGSRGRAGRF